MQLEYLLMGKQIRKKSLMVETRHQEQDECVRLFVDQVPHSISEIQLRQVFQKFMKVNRVIRINADRNFPQKCCFVECPSREEADKAINVFHNKITFLGSSLPMQLKYAYMGIPLTVQWAVRKARNQSRASSVVDFSLRKSAQNCWPFVGSSSSLRTGRNRNKPLSSSSCNNQVQGCSSFSTSQHSLIEVAHFCFVLDEEGDKTITALHIKKWRSCQLQDKYDNWELSVIRGIPPTVKGDKRKTRSSIRKCLSLIGSSCSSLRINRNQYKPDNLKYRLIWRKLPEDVSEAEHSSLFSQFATIKSSNQSYKDFKTKEQAISAIEPLNGKYQMLKGIPLSTTKDKNQCKQSSFSSSGLDGSTVYIDHIPEEIRKVELMNLFGGFGNILRAKVFMNPPFPDRQFGLVRYDSIASAQLAIDKMNGCVIFGCKLIVQFL